MFTVHLANTTRKRTFLLWQIFQGDISYKCPIKEFIKITKSSSWENLKQGWFCSDYSQSALWRHTWAKELFGDHILPYDLLTLQPSLAVSPSRIPIPPSARGDRDCQRNMAGKCPARSSRAVPCFCVSTSCALMSGHPPASAAKRHFRAGSWSGPVQFLGRAGTKMWGEGSLFSLAAHWECWAAANTQIPLWQLSGSCAHSLGRQVLCLAGHTSPGLCSWAWSGRAEGGIGFNQALRLSAGASRCQREKSGAFCGHVKAKIRLFLNWVLGFAPKFGLNSLSH